MDNKKTGTTFEREFLAYLGENGWWAHFITPNATGAQPFDILAIRGRDVYALDCKTCAANRFPLNRVEINQQLAFSQLEEKTEAQCAFICLYENEMYYVPWWLVKAYMNVGQSSIKLTEGMKIDAGNRFEQYKD